MIGFQDMESYFLLISREKEVPNIKITTSFEVMIQSGK